MAYYEDQIVLFMTRITTGDSDNAGDQQSVIAYYD
jgi:hypothetical protein